MLQRARAAGAIVLAGTESKGPTGKRVALIITHFVVLVLAVIGVIFTTSVFLTTMAEGGGSPQAGMTEAQQVVTLLQQMMQEQAQQRQQMDSLQHAIGTTAQGVGITQQVPEGVVNEVVQQVQSTMLQRHQETQEQFQQVASVVQGLQQRMETLNVQMTSGATLPQSSRSAAAQQSGVPNGGAESSQRGTNPFSPLAGGNPFSPARDAQTGAPVRSYAPGGVSPGVNPAIAYALQQGGVDAKVLSKPTSFDPLKQSGYAAFNDWADHVITCVDAQIPGTWEILGYIKDTQPSSIMDADELSLQFPGMDRATLEYSNSNLFAVLITYTSNEARNIVRQARRPNGYEAWKLLHRRFNPVTIGRQRAGLTSIANPSTNVPLAQLSSEIVLWETRIAEFEARPNSEKISESIKMAAIVSMCPNKLKDHLQLNAQRFRNYIDLREEIFGYLDHTQTAAATSMDVGSLQRGSGCYNCGGPHMAKDCPQKGKGIGGGKGGKDKGKGKGPGKDKGKGKKGQAGGKDTQKGKSKPTCNNCGKIGHTRDSCWHPKAKPLNSIDPRLSQLQSEYAKRAMEEFQRTSAASSTTSAAVPSSSASNLSGMTAPSAARALGGVQIKPLGALSMRDRSKRSRQSGEQQQSQDQKQRLERAYSLETFCVKSNLDSGAAISVAPPRHVQRLPSSAIVRRGRPKLDCGEW